MRQIETIDTIDHGIITSHVAPSFTTGGPLQADHIALPYPLSHLQQQPT
jgi:hypothetical protein